MDLEKLSDDLLKLRLHGTPIEQLPYLKAWMEASPKNKEWVTGYMTRQRLIRNMRSILENELEPNQAMHTDMPAGQYQETKNKPVAASRLKFAAAIIALALSIWQIGRAIYKRNPDVVTAMEAERHLPKTASASPMVIFPSGDTIFLNNTRSFTKQIDGLKLTSTDSTKVKLSYREDCQNFTPGWFYIRNPYKNIMDITLPDHSYGSLNAGTTLGYYITGSGPDALARSVSIQGEAVLTVRSNPQAPFFVGTRQGVAMVTGTKFNVTAYDHEKTMRVTLLAGKLKVKMNEATDMAISAGQEATIYAGKAQINIRDLIDTSQVLVWRSKNFDFTDKTIPEIMTQIGHWYGFTQIIYKDNIDIYSKNLLGTGTIAKSSNYQNVLEDLLRGAKLQYEVKGGHILIISKKQPFPGSVNPMQSSNTKPLSFLVEK